MEMGPHKDREKTQSDQDETLVRGVPGVDNSIEVAVF